MDIKHVGDIECISCGECVDVCPTSAIHFKGSKIFLPPDEIDTSALSEGEAEIAIAENKAKREKVKKCAKIFKITVGIIMAVVLGFSLIYYNFIYQPPASVDIVEGQKAPSLDMEVFDEFGLMTEGSMSGNGFGVDENITLTFDPSKNIGKITIVNFWGTWCPGCVAELPYFNQIATEYKDNVTVVAVHTDLDRDTAADFVATYYDESDIIFTFDKPHKENSVVDQYFTDLGGKNDAYPMTVIFDAEGNIYKSFPSAVHYEDLKGAVDSLLNK